MPSSNTIKTGTWSIGCGATAGVRMLFIGGLLFATACGGQNICPLIEALPNGPTEETGGVSSSRYLTIGDSIVAENGWDCQGIAGHLSLELDTYVEDRSAIGWPLSSPGGTDDVINQYEPGPWEWVVISGGANDLFQECGCNGWWVSDDRCQEVLDELVRPEQRSGDLYQIIDRARGDGAKVIIVGYYSVPDDAVLNFDQCSPYGTELVRRYAAVAEAEEGVSFLDAAELMTFESHPTWYKDDHVHPTPRGSEALASAVAQIIRSDQENPTP